MTTNSTKSHAGLGRRALLVAAPATVATSFIARPAAAQTIRWKLVTSLPKGFPGPGVSAERFASRVSTLSGGRLEIAVFAGGELVPPFGTQEAVETGVAEMYHGGGSWFSGRNIGHNFFSVVPFGLDLREFNAWLRHGGGQELWDEMVSPRNLKCFTGGGSGLQSAGWFNKEINSLSDLQGLNFRTSGLASKVLQKIGVNAVTLPPAEIFPALQTGVIDGAEWVGPNSDMAFGLHKVMKYMYAPSFSDVHGGIEFGVNLEAWNALPEDLQLIVQTCAEAESELLPTDEFYGNVAAFEKLKESDIVIGSYSDDIWSALRTAAAEVMEEVRASDELVARIHDSFFDFNRRAANYRQHYDQVYYTQRGRLYSK